MIASGNCRVLVVGRDYVYHGVREIVAELATAFGADAVSVPIAPENAWYGMLRRFPRAAEALLSVIHGRRIAQLEKQQFDIVLFIQVHEISEALVVRYRNAFPSARFILYYWDSLATHDYRRYVKHFDETWTFDPSDARSNAQLTHLPTFFCDRFKALRYSDAFRYDLAFVGTIMTVARYDRVMEFRRWASENGIKFIDYLYVSPLFYLRALLGGRLFRGVHFRPVPEERLVEIYGQARAVLDLPNNTQSGYTPRVFESLGAHRMLVTTKAEIVDEDFYDSRSVFVLGRDGAFPPVAFLRSKPVFSSGIEQYSLRNWLRRLLCLELRVGTAAEDLGT